MLVSILNQLNVNVINNQKAFFTDNATKTLNKYISKADVSIALIDKNTNNNVAFELGIAFGLQKRIIVIGQEQSLLYSSGEFFWIKAFLTDETVLRFQLGAYFSNLTSKVVKKTYKRSKQNSEIIFASKLINGQARGSLLELNLLQAFQESVEVTSIIQDPRMIDREVQGRAIYIPDFAIWTKNFPTPVESPIIIELKSRSILSINYNNVVERLLYYAIKSGAQTGLLLIDQETKMDIEVLHLYPFIVSLSVDKCKQLLRAGQLVSTLQYERNQYAHSAA